MQPVLVTKSHISSHCKAMHTGIHADLAKSIHENDFELCTVFRLNICIMVKL